MAIDSVGLMYGGLHIAEQFSFGKSADEFIPYQVNPLNEFRAIKFNLPWDSYRQNDALKLHMETCRDTLFWQDFMDMMALNRFNSLTLWNLHPFNWMVRLEKYPEASAFTDAEFNEWRNFWKTIFRMAKERGIDTYIVNWNIFVSEDFARAHNVAEYSLTNTYIGVSDTSELVKDYNRECVKEVINQYPNLTGIGFSLGEAMDNMTPAEREQWCLDVFVKGIQLADRKARLIHRVPFSADLGSGGSTHVTIEQMTRNALDTINVPSPVWVEVKFNWSHAHSTSKLIKTHGGEITDTYWNPVPDNYKITWMIRNEDFFALRWGQTDFIRDHLERNVHPYVGGYFVGSECYIPAKDYFTKIAMDSVEWDYAFQRQWMFYKTWGRLLYNPATKNDVFISTIEKKYGNGKTLFRAYNAAGNIPLMIASFWDLAWDFTLYTEGLYSFSGKTNSTEFISIDRLMNHPTLDSSIIDVNTYTKLITDKKQIPQEKITPYEFSDQLRGHATEVLELTKDLPATNPTLLYELADMMIWANLGLYFSEKVKAAVDLSMYHKTGDKTYKTKAVEYLNSALERWENIVEISDPIYKEMPLVHFNYNKDEKYFHWSKLTDQVKEDIEFAKAF
ncbi:MAG: hypothetical protein GVY19_08850 [Bacteroidetes bacterium]|nr:hypothetical protein [Bacteroidota bacterium]